MKVTATRELEFDHREFFETVPMKLNRNGLTQEERFQAIVKYVRENFVEIFGESWNRSFKITSNGYGTIKCITREEENGTVIDMTHKVKKMLDLEFPKKRA